MFIHVNQFIRCSFSKINAVFKSLWAKKLTDYVNVVEMLKRFESGFLVKQAKTFTPQEVSFHFIKSFYLVILALFAFLFCSYFLTS